MAESGTRHHILDTAIELFWAKSYHGVTMNELARTAGVNKATVYQHFTAKEALAVAAVKRAGEQMRENIYLSTFAEVSDPKARLDRIYQKIFEMQDQPHRATGICRGCRFVNIGMEMSATSDDIRSAVNQVFASFRPYYEQIIDDLGAQGARRTDACKQATISTLMANINACQVAAKLENRPEAVRDGAKRARQVLAI